MTRGALSLVGCLGLAGALTGCIVPARVTPDGLPALLSANSFDFDRLGGLGGSDNSEAQWTAAYNALQQQETQDRDTLRAQGKIYRLLRKEVLVSAAVGFADGSASTAKFNNPIGIVMSGKKLYVADLGNEKIRVIDTALSKDDPKFVTTLAEVGPVYDLTADSKGNIYAMQSGSTTVTVVDATGRVSVLGVKSTTLAPLAAGETSAAPWSTNGFITVDPAGGIYLADRERSQIFRIDSKGNVSNLAGSGAHGSVDGQGTAAQFRAPGKITVDAQGNLLLIDRADSDSEPQRGNLRSITPSGLTSTLNRQFVMDQRNVLTNIQGALGLAVTADGTILVASEFGPLSQMGPTGAIVSLGWDSSIENGWEEWGRAFKSDANPNRIASAGSNEVYVSLPLNDNLRHEIIKVTIGLERDVPFGQRYAD